MKRLALLFCITVWLFSCDKNEENLPSQVFEVTVWGVSMDCRLVVIEFKESDREEIEKLSGWNYTSFEAFNLNKELYSTPGQKLKVRVRKPLDSELFPCTTRGPNSPWVTVINAENMD